MQLWHLFVPLSLFASGALADFWIFWENVADKRPGYRFLPRWDPSCADIGASVHWPYWSDDLSRTTGIRIWGGGGPHSSAEPAGMEVHTGRAHFTLYEDRDYRIYDVHDREHGQCFHRLYKHAVYSCPQNAEFHGNRNQLLFYCKSDYDVTYFQG